MFRPIYRSSSGGLLTLPLAYGRTTNFYATDGGGSFIRNSRHRLLRNNQFSTTVPLSLAQQTISGPDRLVVEVSRSTLLNSHTAGRAPLCERSARCNGRCLHNTQQTQETTFRALSGNRTRDPSNRAAADLAYDRVDNGICSRAVTFTDLLHVEKIWCLQMKCISILTSQIHSAVIVRYEFGW
jgi:hypothetical protein